MVRPVDPGPEVPGRRYTDEVPELVGQMRLVAIAMPGGRGGPVHLSLSVEPADHPLQPLHPAEPLRAETHLRREPPPQGPGQQAEPISYLTHPEPRASARGGRNHRRIRTSDHRPSARSGSPPSPRAPLRGRPPRATVPAGTPRTRTTAHRLNRHQVIAQKRQRQARGSSAPRPARTSPTRARDPLRTRSPRPAGRPGDHGPRHLAHLAGPAERAERVPVEVDPQAGVPARAGSSRQMCVIARPFGTRSP